MSTPTEANAESRLPVRLHLGLVVATQRALGAMLRSRQRPSAFVCRHERGDWGEVCPEDWRLNDAAVAHEGDPDLQERVLSAYRTTLGERLWVITEAGRTVTTLLIPDEY